VQAVVFLRPTRENIEMLARELREPMFGEYHLFFSVSPFLARVWGLGISGLLPCCLGFCPTPRGYGREVGQWYGLGVPSALIRARAQ